MSDFHFTPHPLSRTVLARIFSKIEISQRYSYKGDPCWEWTGWITKSGYGQTDPKIAGTCRAHRMMYELFVGHIPSHLQCDHLCRVRHCVNPVHIEPVSALVNTMRSEAPSALNAAKTHCIRGHAFEGNNLLIDAKGYRQCKTCQRKRNRDCATRERRANGVPLTRKHTTHCIHGHEYAPANTYFQVRRRRGHTSVSKQCRECRNANARRRRQLHRSLK